MNKLSILIVVIVYNPSHMILDNLSISGYSMLVIDNSENINIWLQDHCKLNNIVYIANKINLGIAKALNIGAEYALQNGYEYIVTLDQDSNFTQYILQQLINFTVSYPDREYMAVVSPKHLIRLGEMPIKSNKIQHLYQETILTMSSGNLLNLKIWQKIGGFKADLFIDLVDTEYYARSRKFGYKTFELYNVLMPHSLGKLFIKVFLGREFRVMNHNHIRKYYQVRNSLYLLANTDLKPGERDAIKHLFLKSNFFGVVFFEKDKLKKLFFMLLAYFDYVRGRYGKCPW